MITTIILAVLGALLAFVVWQMMRGPKRSASVATMPSPGEGAASRTVPGSDLWNAKPGDVISIQGAAEDFSDLDFTVDGRNAYQSADRQWIGLAGDFRGRRVYLEVSRAAGLEIIGVLSPTSLTLPDVGLTEDGLADIDARQDPSASIQYDGKRWNYQSSRELAYLEKEQEPAKGLYRWLFAEQNGSRLVRVEKWEGEPFDVRLATKVNSQDVTVYPAT